MKNNKNIKTKGITVDYAYVIEMGQRKIHSKSVARLFCGHAQMCGCDATTENWKWKKML